MPMLRVSFLLLTAQLIDNQQRKLCKVKVLLADGEVSITVNLKKKVGEHPSHSEAS
jgi:hypothetical protein